MPHNKKKKHQPLRVVLTVSCVVLGLVLALLVAGTVYAEYLLNQMNFHDTPRETLPPDVVQALLDETDPIGDFTGTEMDPYEVTHSEMDIIPTSENLVNILLIGADYQSGDIARSDSMILCTFNKSKDTITMTSFLRDMYVYIPGYGSMRINTSYALGGMDLLKDTLEYNFGVQVDGIVEIDFSHFKDLIDLLGGVELDVNKAEASFINLKNKDHLKSGVQVLNGAQALWYSRFRGDATGDFGRTERQREVLSVLIEEYRSVSLTDLLSMLDDILPMVTTNMTKTEILSYVSGLFPMLMDAEIGTQRIPAEGGYYMTRIDGKSVLVPDMEAQRQHLRDTLLR